MLGALPPDTVRDGEPALCRYATSPVVVAVVALVTEMLLAELNPTVINFGVIVYEVEFVPTIVARGSPYTLPSTVFKRSASSAVPLPAIYNPVSFLATKSINEFFNDNS